MTNLIEGDLVIINNDCTNTQKSYGFDNQMKNYFGTWQVVDHNDCTCGCVRLKGINYHWHVDDLKKVTDQPDVKKKIKPVLFNEEQIIQGD